MSHLLVPSLVAVKVALLVGVASSSQINKHREEVLAIGEDIWADRLAGLVEVGGRELREQLHTAKPSWCNAEAIIDEEFGILIHP